jgi:hypothetical protein
MGEIRFKPKPGGEREIRYWDSTRSVLEGVAYTIAETANSQLKLNGPRDVDPGYKIESKRGKLVGPKGFGRWRVSVTAVTRHAIRHNAVHNTLLRALGGAR